MDYAKIYDGAWDELPETRLLPGGHWTLANDGVHFFKSKKEGVSPQLAFFYKPVSPAGDVDKRALKEAGDYDWSENGLGAFFWFGNAKDKRKIVQHIQMHAGVTIPDGEPLLVTEAGELKVNPKVREAMQGGRIQGNVGEEPGKDNEPRNIVKSFIPVEA